MSASSVPSGSPAPPAPPARTTFRLPRTTYLVVLFLFLGVLPFALGGGSAGSISLTPFVALLVVPVVAALFVARTATVVDADGITVRAVFGSRLMRWQEVRGISVDGGTVYAVLGDGAVRLPCVQLKTLSALAEAAGDRLPDLPRPVYKQPPGARRPRR